MPTPDHLRPILDQLGSGATVAMAETVHRLLEQARTGTPTPPVAEAFEPGVTYIVRDTAGDLDEEARVDYLREIHERVGCFFVVVGPEVEVSAATLGAADLTALTAAHAELAELQRKAPYLEAYEEENERLRTELDQTMGALTAERTTRAATVRTLRDALAIANSVIDSLIAARRSNVDAESPAEVELHRIRAMIADLLEPTPQDGATAP